MGNAVIIPVKDAGNAFPAQEDHGVGERLEPALHPGGERLPRLGIVVIHKGDRPVGPFGGQSAVEDPAHVKAAVAGGSLYKVKMQRHVKQPHDQAGFIQIMDQGLHVRAPVFPDGGKAFSRFFPKLHEPVAVKGKPDVLDRVQPEAVHPGHIQIPFAPAVQLCYYLGIVHIQIGAHQIVIISVFRIHLIVPFLSRKLKDLMLLSAVVPVHAGEVGMIPLKTGIFSAPAGKTEAGPGGYFLRRPFLLVPVGIVAFLRQHGLAAVRAHFMVQDDVRKHGKPRLMQRLYGRKIFVFGAVLRGNASLLVKFSQIVKIIDAVAHVRPPLRPLIGGRQPYVGKARLLQMRRIRRGPFPVPGVFRQIPFKVLNHGFIFIHEPVSSRKSFVPF